MNNESLKDFPFFESKRWLVNSLESRLPDDLRNSAKELVELHLDPRNFPMGLIDDFDSIILGLKNGFSADELKKYLIFEDTSSISGICRVMVRTHLNGQGAGFVYRSLNKNIFKKFPHLKKHKLRNPRVLDLFPTDISIEKLTEFCDYQLFVKAWHELALNNNVRDFPDNPYAFTEVDINSLQGLIDYPIEKKKNLPDWIHNNWAKIVWGIFSGITHLKNHYNFDPIKIRSIVEQASGNSKLIDELIYKTAVDPRTKIAQFGKPLAHSFFADLGFPDFIKLDVHVRESIAALLNSHSVPDHICLQIVRECAVKNKVAARSIDKIMYIACSSNFYFYSPEKLPFFENEKQSFLQFLSKFY